MTIEEMKASDKAMLSTNDVSEVLGIHPFAISLKAKNNDLPFPFFRSGNIYLYNFLAAVFGPGIGDLDTDFYICAFHCRTQSKLTKR